MPLKFLALFMWISVFLNTCVTSKDVAVTKDGAAIFIVIVQWLLVIAIGALGGASYHYEIDEYIVYACNLLTVFVGLTSFDIENNRATKDQMSMAMLYRLRSSALWFLLISQWLLQSTCKNVIILIFTLACNFIIPCAYFATKENSIMKNMS